MGLSAAESGCPVFLLGVGRCGSTFWQSLLCRADGLWIWGEHEAILRPILGTRQTIARSLDFPGPETPPMSLAEIERALPANGNAIAWNNGFRAEDLDAELRGLVDGLMRRRLPPGKTRWGFKEIRYGNSLPERPDPTAHNLLTLFPQSHVVLTLRHPRPTIASSVRSFWAQDVAAAGTAPDRLRDRYGHMAHRWRRATEELLDLADEHGDRVVRVMIEDVPAGRSALAAALGVCLPEEHPVVNAHLRVEDPSPMIDEIFRDMWHSWRPRLAATMQRAGYDGAAAERTR